MSNPVFWFLEKKKKKKNINLSSAELAQRVVKVKALITTAADTILILFFRFFLSEKIRLEISGESSA